MRKRGSALEEGEKIVSYFQKLLKYIELKTKSREYYKKGHRYKDFNSQVKSQ